MGYAVAVLVGGGGRDGELSRAGAQVVCEALQKAGHRTALVECAGGMGSMLRAGGFDAAWPVLAGELGRSGEVQELVEAAGLPCVGSASGVCRRMRDRRELVRSVAEALEVRTIEASVPWTETLGARGLEAFDAAELLEGMAGRIPGGYPLVVKPVLGGTGVAARTAGDLEELRAAVADVAATGGAAIQEQVEGVEMRVCVLGDADDICVLPPVEVCAGGELVVPVRYESLSPDRADAEAIRSAVERAALDAFLVCGCCGLAEVQLVWDGATPRLLDVDTAPRLDREGALVRAIEACGFALDEELDIVLEAAM